MLKYNDYINTPAFQNADDAGREDLRNRYWNEHLAPHIPFEQQGAMRQKFDQRTAPKGNPYQGYWGDLADATQQGFYGGMGDLASGVDYLVGGDGENAVADYFRGKADQQWQEMSPSGQQAMQGFGIEADPDQPNHYGFTDTSTPAGFGLQFASGLGSFAPSMIPGGAAARLLGWGAKGKRALDVAGKAKNIKTVDDARRLHRLDKRIDQAAFATGYGIAGGAMIGAGAAEQAKQVVLAAGYNDLKDLPRFQTLYQQTYAANGQGDTRTAFNQARELLAAEAGREAFNTGAGVGAVSMGVAGPLLDKIGRGMGAASRHANAVKGGAVEGVQEFTEGYGQHVASNLAQQHIGLDVATTAGAMEQGLSGAVIGAPVGGSVGMIPSPRRPVNQDALQQKVTDLYSQRQTLQGQLTEQDIDPVMIQSLLQENAQAIAAAEVALRQPTNSINLGRAVNVQRAVNMDEPEMETVADPTAKPTSWQDHNPAPDYGQYDRPSYQRRADTPPQDSTPDPEAQPATGPTVQVVDNPQPMYSDRETPQAPAPAAPPTGTEIRPETHYTGNEDTDLQLYASRANGLNKVLHGHKWKAEQKPLKDQLKRVIQQRKALEKDARSSARQLAEPFTPKDIQGKLNTIQQELKAGNDFYLGDELTALERQTQKEQDQLKQLQALSGQSTESGQRPADSRQKAREKGDSAGETETTNTEENAPVKPDQSTVGENTPPESGRDHTETDGQTEGYTTPQIKSKKVKPDELTDAQKEAGNDKKELKNLQTELKELKRIHSELDELTLKDARDLMSAKGKKGEENQELEDRYYRNLAAFKENKKKINELESKISALEKEAQPQKTDYAKELEEKRAIKEANVTSTTYERAKKKLDKQAEGFVSGSGAPSTKGISKPATPTEKKTDKKSLKKIAETPAAKSDRPSKGKKASDKPAEKIEDFGEKIGGARKDMWASFRDAFHDDVDVAALPLSKTFPQPDYVKLSEAGIDNETLAIIAALRADFSVKPRKAHKLGRWAREVEEARDITRSLIDGEKTSTEVLEAMAGDNKDVYRKRGIAHFVPVLKRFKPEQMKLLANFRMRSGSFSMLDGQKFDGFKTQYFLESGGRMKGRNTSADTLEEAQKKAFEYLSSEVESMGEKKGRQTSFGVFRGRTSKEFWIGKKVAAGKLIELKSGFTDSKDAFAFIKDNQQWLEDELKKKKDIPAHRRSTNLPRVGDDYRKGKDVTPEQFADAFGFRGVEFGNWVEQGKRQQDLNEAYDALHDLAAVLGIPPKALSLNGELGLAFGARGRGGAKAAKAHYEPDRVVINLTKKAGPGSLAHEWWHALDNYFAREGGDQYGFVSKDGIRREYRDGQFHPSEKVRLKVQDAFKAVTQAIKNTDLPKRAKELDKTRSKDYWSTMVEMTARTFEGFVINKLDAAGMANDYLANITGPEVFADANVDYPYLLAAEAPKVDKSFADFFTTLKHRKTDKGIQLYRYRTSDAKGLKQGPLKIKLAPLEKKLGFPVTVLQSETQLPSEVYRDVIRDGARGRVRGIYDNGRAFVIADNLDSVEEATRTVLHEVVGHAGVRQVAGKRLDTVLDQIHRDMSTGLKKALTKRYARQLNGKDAVTGHRIIAEEYLAHLAETNPQNHWVQKVIAVVRNALRRLFPKIEWRPEDVVELLSSSRRALRVSGQRAAGSGQRYRDAGHADAFYSAVERGAAAVKSDTLPAQSWLNAIKKHPHITDEEVTWMGLDLFLDSKKGQKLKKQEVLDYIRANRIEIEEVKYSQQEFDRQEDAFRTKWIASASKNMEHGETLTDRMWSRLLDEHRNKLWEEDRDYFEEEIRSALNNDPAVETDIDRDNFLDDNGDVIDERVYQRAAEDADINNDEMTNQEVFEQIPLEEREVFASELYQEYGGDEFETDLEPRHKRFSTDGGNDYTELLFTLPDNATWLRRAVDTDHRIDAKELHTLKQGEIPTGISIERNDDIAYLYDNNSMWQPFRQFASGNKEPIGPMMDSRQAVIDDLIKTAESPYLKPLESFYIPTHWSEQNVLAHVRFQTFYDHRDIKRNKVLLIDEVQSDWHQQGRETGYKSPEQKQALEKEYDRIDNERKKIVRKELEKLKEKTFKYEPLWTPTQTKEVKIKDALDGWLNSELPTNTAQEKIREQAIQAIHQLNPHTQLGFLTSDLNAISAKLRDYDDRPSDAPLKQNWPNLVMKRMLRHAAEHGFDKVAWTTGAQQDKRYRIGNHLRSINVRPVYSTDSERTIESYQVEWLTHNGYRDGDTYEAGLLEDAIGNRLAREVREQAEQQRQGKNKEIGQWGIHPQGSGFYLTDKQGSEIRGENKQKRIFDSEEDARMFIEDFVFDDVQSIKMDNLDEVVGGDQGMTAFYDQRLVNYMKKYTKKWGGKVDKTELETRDGDQEFWSVIVTDKMRDSVLRDGQAMFALKDRGVFEVKANALLKKGKFHHLMDSARNYGFQHLDKTKVFNADLKKDIWFTKKGIKHIYSKKANQVLAELAPHLPEIVRRATFDTIYDSDKRGVLNIGEVFDLSLPVRVKGSDYTVDIVVKEHTNDQMHRIYGMELWKGSANIQPGDHPHNLVITDVSLRDISAPDKSIDQRKAEKFGPTTKGGDTRYALKSDLPGEVEDVITGIHGGIGKRRKWTERVKEWFQEHPAVGTKKGIYQGTLDAYHSIAVMEREANGGKLMEAAQSAYKAALRTKNREGVMTALLGKGTPKLDNGSVVFRDGSKGFLDVMEPIAQKGELELWETWAASKRAMRLMKEGKEHLYTPERIKTIQTYVSSMPGMEQRFQQVFDDYQTFNGQILDFAQQAGLIDAESRKLWDKGDYIPFHRVHEVGDAAGEQFKMFGKKGLSGQKSGIKQLTGGVEKISPLEAMYRNTEALIDASFKNIAMQRIADLGVDTGALTLTRDRVRLSRDDVKAKLAEMNVDTDGLTPEQLKRWQALLSKFTDTGEGTVTVSRDGKPSSYQVNDPLLLDAITELGPQNLHWMLKLLSIPKQVLTQLVTADPGFMVRNLFRDTLSTWMTVHPEINGKPLKVNPIVAAARTAKKKIDNDDTRWSLMMAGGGSGGFYDMSPDNIRRKLSPSEQQKIINKPGQLWDAWQKFGSRFENANRLHVFENTIKQGGSVAEAAHQAQDVLNFTRKGQWQLMNILVSSLPFFNARIQGLDRLWRGAKQEGKSGLAAITPSFVLRGTMYAAASTALLAMYDDDERYTSLPEWDKLNYHHIWLGDTHYRIPKPFEVGAIFGTVPEMAWQTAMGNEDLKWAKKMAGGMIFQTLAFDPVPQAVRPALDVAINRSSFTDMPIVPLGLQYVKPEAQYDPWTSETLKQLVKAVPEGAPDWLRSPKKLQYVLQGYFGTLGRYAIEAADVMTRQAVKAPQRPALRARDVPVVGSFVRDGVDSTRYRGELYDMQKELTDLKMTINRYKDSGEKADASKLKLENKEKLAAQKGINRYARRISTLKKQIRKIMDDRLMTARIKRDKIDALSRRVNQLSAEAVGKYGGRF